MSKLHNGLLFIGDPLLSTTRPGRRKDDDFLGVISEKLLYCLNLAKEKNLQPIILGGLTNRTFEIKVLSRLMEVIKGHNPYVLASKQDFIKGKEELNPNSTAGILSLSGMATVIVHTGLSGIINISNGKNGPLNISLYSVMEDGVIPSSITSISDDCMNIIISRCEVSNGTEESSGTIPHEIDNCALIVSGNNKLPINCGDEINTTWLVPGPLARTESSQDSMEPTVWSWTPGTGLFAHIIPHQASVMDTTGLTSEKIQEVYTNSQFATLLREEARSASSTDESKDLLEEEIKKLLSEKEVRLESREIVYELKKQTDGKESVDFEDDY